MVTIKVYGSMGCYENKTSKWIFNKLFIDYPAVPREGEKFQFCEIVEKVAEVKWNESGDITIELEFFRTHEEEVEKIIGDLTKSGWEVNKFYLPTGS